ncbi:MAG: hypothetical protein ACI8RZ_005038 [Myxococcota bacterium]|jgi:hypothetical protein
MKHMMILAVLLAGCDDSLGDGSADDEGMAGLYDQGMPGLFDESGGGGSDADGDGFSSGEEQQAGTNPNYAPSHPYIGGYNVGYCNVEPVPTGPTGNNGYNDSYQEGDVVENFTLTDQHGEEVELYSFCGQNVMLAIGAFW